MKEGSEGARENRAAGHNVRTTEERGKKEGSCKPQVGQWLLGSGLPRCWWSQ